MVALVWKISPPGLRALKLIRLIFFSNWMSVQNTIFFWKIVPTFGIVHNFRFIMFGWNFQNDLLGARLPMYISNSVRVDFILVLLVRRPENSSSHDDVIKWKHFPRNWPFVRWIHRSPVNSPHKGQWCVALMFSLICVWMNGGVNNREAGDLRRYRAHYDVTVV